MNEQQRKFIQVQDWTFDINEIVSISPIIENEKNNEKGFYLNFKDRSSIDFDYKIDLFTNDIDECEKDRNYILRKLGIDV